MLTNITCLCRESQKNKNKKWTKINIKCVWFFFVVNKPKLTVTITSRKRERDTKCDHENGTSLIQSHSVALARVLSCSISLSLFLPHSLVVSRSLCCVCGARQNSKKKEKKEDYKKNLLLKPLLYLHLAFVLNKWPALYAQSRGAEAGQIRE